MEDSVNPFKLAFDLMASGDAALWQVVGLSMLVSGLATLLAMFTGCLIAGGLALGRFRGRGLLLALFRTFTGMPAVVVGLLVYLALSRSGPLGVLGLLYTPTAMIIAQFLLIVPLVVTLAYDILDQGWSRIGDLLRAYNFSRIASLKTVAFEGRFLLVTVALTAFGRAIAEVGAVMIVGGNIEGFTRVMTTAIALETSRGDLALALALGLLLLLVSLLVNLAASGLTRKAAR